MNSILPSIKSSLNSKLFSLTTSRPIIRSTSFLFSNYSTSSTTSTTSSDVASTSTSTTPTTPTESKATSTPSKPTKQSLNKSQDKKVQFKSSLLDEKVESNRKVPTADWATTFDTNEKLETDRQSRGDVNRGMNKFQGTQSNYNYVQKLETQDDVWSIKTALSYPAPLTTITARSLVVMNSNVALAYRKLNRTLQENNLRREVKRQERFESKSDKRVRLDSERHRRRFKVAVGKSVGLSMREL